MLYLRFDPSHRTGQPSQSYFEAIRPQRSPNLGATDQVSSVTRDAAAIVEMASSKEQPNRAFV